MMHTRLLKKLGAGLLLAALLVSSATAETVTYLHTDLLGSVVLETDQNRNVVARYEYEPYGLPRQVIADAPGYTGHVHDAGSELVYMQQRYYDPEVGRFLSVDPVGVDVATGANFNRYWYGNNNPYTYTDPDGRAACIAAPPAPACFAAIAAVARAIVSRAAPRPGVIIVTSESSQDSDEPGERQSTDVAGPRPGDAFPDRPLPRDPLSGEPVVDDEAAGVPHTQLGTRDGSKGKYPQAREFDSDGKEIKTRDFTDHGRPKSHTNPHDHVRKPNPSGGTPQRGKAEPPPPREPPKTRK